MNGDTFVSRASSRLVTLLLLFTIVLGLYVVGSAVAGFVHGRTVTFQGSVSVTAEDAQLPAYVDAPGVADVTVHIHDANDKQQTLAATRDLIPIVMVAWGLWLLRGLLVSVRKSDPFNERN